MTGRVAIIGAGMAGLAAARRLRAAGVECVVFEKSRGLGGRMATRRDGDLRFDHGAQYFTARGKRFKALIEAGAAAEWFEGAFVGVPGMSGPAREMAEGLEVAGGVQASGLRRDADGWRVLDAEGARDGAFAAVLLAVPAPQAVPLAASAGVAFLALEAVRYAPCWALMLTFDGPSGLTEDHRRFESGAISWIARNGSKPGRDPAPETLVVHAAPDWSRVHLEMSKEDAAAALVVELPGVGVTAAPARAVAHRWRYAMVERAAGVPYLWDSAAGIGACGDWCLGPRVEAAFDSGDALGAAVAEALS
jgi:predicted NAD/FAD-dependent oxidoreductase